jgi:MFS family permease
MRLVRAFAVLGGLSQSLAGAAAALLARDVAGSDAAGGLPQSLLVVGAGVSALALAALTRRWGRALALAVGAMTAAVGCLAMALGGAANALVPIVAGSLLLGAGNTAVMLSRYAAAELETGRSAPRAMASVLVATSVGAVLGPNLLQPSGLLMQPFDVSPLIGSYVVAGLVYAAGAGVVLRARVAFPPRIPAESSSPAPSPDPSAPAPSTGSLRHHPAGRVGFMVLAIANLVMVGVMTMAPVHLAHLGGGLWLIGLVISAHIGAMFGPSALSGWLTERLGAAATANVSAAVLVMACVMAALAGHSALTLAVAMVILGLGWNVALVSGSALLTHGVPAAARPARESLGEVGMAVAATVGGATSGLAMARWDYATLALLGTAAATLLLLWLIIRPARGRPA